MNPFELAGTLGRTAFAIRLSASLGLGLASASIVERASTLPTLGAAAPGLLTGLALAGIGLGTSTAAALRRLRDMGLPAWPCTVLWWACGIADTAVAWSRPGLAVDIPVAGSSMTVVGALMTVTAMGVLCLWPSRESR